MPIVPPRHVLLVDFGGVLTSSVWAAFAGACADRGLQPDAIKQLFREEPAVLRGLRKVETGQHKEAFLAAILAQRLGIDPDGLLDDVLGRLQFDDVMVDLVRRVRRSGRPIGLISNSLGVERYDQRLLDELFDTYVISGQVGLHKPQPAIYQLAATRLNAQPDECVFVDDLKENCVGALRVGMAAVRHRHAGLTVREVEALLGMPQRPSPGSAGVQDLQGPRGELGDD